MGLKGSGHMNEWKTFHMSVKSVEEYTEHDQQTAAYGVSSDTITDGQDLHKLDQDDFLRTASQQHHRNFTIKDSIWRILGKTKYTTQTVGMARPYGQN